MANRVKKYLCVATVVKTHVMEFHIPTLKMMKDAGWDTAVAARNDYEKPDECQIPGCDEYFNLQFERNPFHPRNIKAYKRFKKIISDGQYDIIHCHTPVGGVIARIASRKVRKTGTKVIYTAHGFHFYKEAPLINWLLYFPVEWLCAHWTDVLITINREDYELAKRHMHAKRVEYIPGVGIDVARFANTKVDRAQKRREIGVPEDAFLLVSVGELNDNKNHQVVIQALAELDNKNIHYVIAGRGDKENYLRSLANNLGVGEQVHLLGYRTDVNELYKAGDVFVLPSKREGLNVSIMEAANSALPCIASDIRGVKDVVDIEGALFFSPNDKNSLVTAISKLAAQPELCEQMGQHNRKVCCRFEFGLVKKRMCDIYEEATKSI